MVQRDEPARLVPPPIAAAAVPGIGVDRVAVSAAEEGRLRVRPQGGCRGSGGRGGPAGGCEGHGHGGRRCRVRRRVRRHGVAAVRLLQGEEEQRQVREQPPDLPPLPDLQGRRVHLVPEMQGLQMHHISRKHRIMIDTGMHSKQIELEIF